MTLPNDSSIDAQLIIGAPKEWKDFLRRHRLFFERFRHLKDALDCTFIKERKQQ